MLLPGDDLEPAVPPGALLAGMDVATVQANGERQVMLLMYPPLLSPTCSPVHDRSSQTRPPNRVSVDAAATAASSTPVAMVERDEQSASACRLAGSRVRGRRDALYSRLHRRLLTRDRQQRGDFA